MTTRENVGDAPTWRRAVTSTVLHGEGVDGTDQYVSTVGGKPSKPGPAVSSQPPPRRATLGRARTTHEKEILTSPRSLTVNLPSESMLQTRISLQSLRLPTSADVSCISPSSGTPDSAFSPPSSGSVDMMPLSPRRIRENSRAARRPGLTRSATTPAPPTSTSPRSALPVASARPSDGNLAAPSFMPSLPSLQSQRRLVSQETVLSFLHSQPPESIRTALMHRKALWNRAAFLDAVERRDHDMLDSLLLQKDLDVNYCGANGTPLTMAIRNVDIRILRQLCIHSSLDPNKPDHHYPPILHAFLLDPTTIAPIRQQGTRRSDVDSAPNQLDLSSDAAKSLWQIRTKYEVVAALLDIPGINVNVHDPHTGYTPLMFAAKDGKLDLVHRLLRLNARTSHKAQDGQTAFSMSFAGGYPEIGFLLKEHQSNVLRRGLFRRHKLKALLRRFFDRSLPTDVEERVQGVAELFDYVQSENDLDETSRQKLVSRATRIGLHQFLAESAPLHSSSSTASVRSQMSGHNSKVDFLSFLQSEGPPEHFGKGKPDYSQLGSQLEEMSSRAFPHSPPPASSIASRTDVALLAEAMFPDSKKGTPEIRIKRAESVLKVVNFLTDSQNAALDLPSNHLITSPSSSTLSDTASPLPTSMSGVAECPSRRESAAKLIDFLKDSRPPLETSRVRTISRRTSNMRPVRRITSPTTRSSPPLSTPSPSSDMPSEGGRKSPPLPSSTSSSKKERRSTRSSAKRPSSGKSSLRTRHTIQTGVPEDNATTVRTTSPGKTRRARFTRSKSKKRFLKKVESVRRQSVGAGSKSSQDLGTTQYFDLTVDELVTRDATQVPAVFAQLIEVLFDLDVANVEGIFRISCDKTVLNQVSQYYAQTGLLMAEIENVHVAASFLKVWLRRLPEPLLKNHRELAALSEDEDDETRLIETRALIAQLPRTYQLILRTLFDTLVVIAENAHVNKMTYGNLAVVFAPNLIHLDDVNTSPEIYLAQFASAQSLVSYLFFHAHSLFAQQIELTPPEDESEAYPSSRPFCRSLTISLVYPPTPTPIWEGSRNRLLSLLAGDSETENQMDEQVDALLDFLHFLDVADHDDEVELDTVEEVFNQVRATLEDDTPSVTGVSSTESTTPSSQSVSHGASGQLPLRTPSVETNVQPDRLVTADTSTSRTSSDVAEEYLEVKVQLQMVLDHPEARAMFRHWLERVFAVENLVFWERASEFQKHFEKLAGSCHGKLNAPQYAALCSSAEKIFNDFVADDAESPINISSWHVTRLHEYFTTIDILPPEMHPYMFDEAINAVSDLLTLDLFSRFRVTADGVSSIQIATRAQFPGLVRKVELQAVHVEKMIDLSMCTPSQWSQPDFVGMLYKKGHIRRNWKLRQFKLQHGLLFYFTPEDAVPKAVVDLQLYIVVDVHPKIRRDNGFAIVPRNPRKGAEVYLFAARSASEKSEWISVLKKTLGQS